ncbi:MAG: hypothetical protein M1840_004266 [Geoglossum simile]|nr:MAG: hypothetical protein M1840_004266 [Geoglossum simile]
MINHRADHSPDTEPQIADLPLTSISKLAPFSALISSIIFVIYFFIKNYILEGFLLRRMYGSMYTNLSDANRRGFLNHHIAGATKIVILIIGAYPFIAVAMGLKSLYAPYSKGSAVMLGDILVVASQMLIAMYVFELIYRPKVSPISMFHHVGAIMVGQSAIAVSLNLVRQKDADIEFILCCVWGAFDIVSEFLPHTAIILYRVYPSSHKFLRNLFRTAFITTLTGTIFETVVVMYLFGKLWNRWTLAFKIVTPVLHIAFSACQLHGSCIFWKMMKRQQNYIREAAAGEDIGPMEEGRKAEPRAVEALVQ